MKILTYDSDPETNAAEHNERAHVLEEDNAVLLGHSCDACEHERDTRVLSAAEAARVQEDRTMYLQMRPQLPTSSYTRDKASVWRLPWPSAVQHDKGCVPTASSTWPSKSYNMWGLSAKLVAARPSWRPVV